VTAMQRIADVVAVAAERISAILGARGMRLMARFQRRVTNPLLRRWVTRLPNMAVIEHRGRKSGKRYETPVMAFVHDREFLVVLNYSATSDWVRNVQAAGSATIRYGNRCYRLDEPRVVPIDSPGLPRALRTVRTPERCALRGSLIPE